MTSTEKVWLRVIFVAETEERSKLFGATINKAGYSIKGAAVNSLNTLKKNLEKPDWDIIVVDTAFKQLPLKQISELLSTLNSPLPLLALNEDTSTQARQLAMAAGAVDLAPPDAPELVSWILKRELKHSNHVQAVTSENTATSQELSKEDIVWRDRLTTALKENRLISVFQPIVNLCAQPGENYEALLRMLDENDQEILPGAFIGVAEKTGLMNQIDRWVISHTINTISERHISGVKTCFFVKLSETTLTDSTFFPWLSEQIHQKNIPAKSLVLEISEALSVKHKQQTKALFASLRQLDCLTALDHVGAEDSQDSAWTSFDLDFIKIAGRLIRDLASNTQSQKDVTFIASQAKARKIKTVAQFIQDTTSLTFLYQHSINYIQGYYLQRPEATLSYNFEESEG